MSATSLLLPLAEARELAREAAVVLGPEVARLEVAGSLRRGRELVGDIEFVAEARLERDLFGEPVPAIDPVRRALASLGEWRRGGKRMMQVADLLGREGARLELYLVHPPAQWGSILAIRTGPWRLGQYCVTAMRDRGYRHHKGHAIHLGTGKPVPTPDEADFFRLAGVPCLAPALRDRQAAELMAGAVR